MTKPVVLIDARMVGPVLHGVARYVTLMAKGLDELRGRDALSYEPVFLIDKSFDPASFGSPLASFKTERTEIKYLSLSELTALPRTISKVGASLYHSPSFSSLWYCPCPWITTVHDLNHMTYGSLPKKLYYQLILKRFMRKARGVLTVSKFSRAELSAWSGIPEGRIEIAYNALEPSLVTSSQSGDSSKVLARFGLEKEKYFYSLSNPKPHKNIALLVEAYSKFREGQKKRRLETYPLVLTLEGFAAEGVISIGGLQELEARTLLANAAALFFPSLYEGFGLPPAEAAVAGVRLAVSDIPAHHEALVDLSSEEAVWVDPRDVNGWVHAFEVAQAGQIRRPSSESGEKLMKRYSPLALGVHMDQLYRRMLSLG